MRNILFFALLFTFVGLGAITRLVPSDYTTIQGAITACNNGDMVRVAPGTYTENINFEGKAIIVSSDYIFDMNQQTIMNTVINGTGSGSVVTFTTNEDTTSVLVGFSVTGGNFALGGGISVRNASPTLNNLVIYNNTGSYSGGVYLQNSCAIVNRLTICHNTGYGIRINAGCPVNVNSCIVYYNTYGVISSSPLALVTFCNIQEMTDGTGNINEEPGFADHLNNNFLLQAASPCVNTGSPFIIADLDGTRPDMGALYFQNDAEDIYIQFEANHTVMIANPTVSASFTCSIITFNCTDSTYLWTFGDGGTSDQISPTHIYEHGGYFTISLTITSNTGAQHTLVRDRYLTVYTSMNYAPHSGTLLNSISPYYAEMPFVVTEGTQLIIEPGVEIYLDSNSDLSIYGEVVAIGTEQDSILIQGYNHVNTNSVNIISSATNLFQYCHFKELNEINVTCIGTGLTTFEDCLIEDNETLGIRFIAGYGTIKNSVIRNNGAMTQTSCGIYIDSPHVLVENNQIYGNTICSIQVWCNDGLGTVIKDNTIVNGMIQASTVAVLTNSSAILMGNDISGGSMGIGFDSGSYAYILNNTIHDNNWGIYLFYMNNDNPTIIQGNLIRDNHEDGICHVNSSAEISNNTIVNNNAAHAVNSAGIFIAYACNSHIVNNIFWGNTNDFARYEGNSLPEVSYNYTEFALPAIVTNMGNNVIGDPGFISETDFRLAADSPCIDTGNPDSLYYSIIHFDLAGFPRLFDGDNNGTATIDRGCYEYNPGQANEDNYCTLPDKIILSNYPNPFNPNTTITFDLQAKGRISLKVYNLKGELVKSLSEGLYGAGKHSIAWNGRDNNNKPAASGLYFYSIKAGNKVSTHKMMLLK